MNTATKKRTKQIATVLSIAMVSGLFSACAFLKKEQVQDKEILLVQAGFKQTFSSGPDNLAYLKTIFDCDALTQTCSPEKVKRITRTTLKKMGRKQC